jgi:hypothetical protein
MQIKIKHEQLEQAIKEYVSRSTDMEVFDLEVDWEGDEDQGDADGVICHVRPNLQKGKMTDDEYTRSKLQEIARSVEIRLPDRYGFFVMVFPFGGDDDNRSNYVSNAQRKDVLNTMKEFMIKCGAEEDWMRHL